jgi:hypothetical protein
MELYSHIMLIGGFLIGVGIALFGVVVAAYLLLETP